MTPKALERLYKSLGITGERPKLNEFSDFDLIKELKVDLSEAANCWDAGDPDACVYDRAAWLSQQCMLAIVDAFARLRVSSGEKGVNIYLMDHAVELDILVPWKRIIMDCFNLSWDPDLKSIASYDDPDDLRLGISQVDALISKIKIISKYKAAVKKLADLEKKGEEA